MRSNKTWLICCGRSPLTCSLCKLKTFNSYIRYASLFWEENRRPDIDFNTFCIRVVFVEIGINSSILIIDSRIPCIYCECRIWNWFHMTCPWRTYSFLSFNRIENSIKGPCFIERLTIQIDISSMHTVLSWIHKPVTVKYCRIRVALTKETIRKDFLPNRSRIDFPSFNNLRAFDCDIFTICSSVNDSVIIIFS